MMCSLASALDLFATRPIVRRSRDHPLLSTSLCLRFNENFPSQSSKSSTCFINGILACCRHPHRRVSLRCSSGKTNGDSHSPEIPEAAQDGLNSLTRIFYKWKVIDSTELKERMAKLGIAAVLAYLLLSCVIYTTFFVIVFLGYEKSTGKNPAANLRALLGLVLLMWTGNTITRPFRLAGAAAVAPLVDKELKRVQNCLKLPNLFIAFAIVIVVATIICYAVVGLLILSRFGK